MDRVLPRQLDANYLARRSGRLSSATVCLTIPLCKSPGTRGGKGFDIFLHAGGFLKDGATRGRGRLAQPPGKEA
jgi:hypothetical protein